MIIMNNNSTAGNYKSESEAAQLVPDDTQNTDFTQIACSVFKEEPADQGSREARAALISDSIEEDQPVTIRLFISRLLGLK
jgi:hypothetical protein